MSVLADHNSNPANCAVCKFVKMVGYKTLGNDDIQNFQKHLVTTHGINVPWITGKPNEIIQP